MEGLVTYTQGNFAERTAQTFCQEGRAALVNGKCTYRKVVDPDKDDIVKNLIIEKRDCFQYIDFKYHGPEYCLGEDMEKGLDDYGDYTFFAAIFTWLGRENV